MNTITIQMTMSEYDLKVLRDAVLYARNAPGGEQYSYRRAVMSKFLADTKDWRATTRPTPTLQVTAVAADNPAELYY